MELKLIDQMVLNIRTNKKAENTTPLTTYKTTILENFNINKANHEQFCEYAMALTEKGVLTFKEYAIITFNPELSPQTKISGENYFCIKKDSKGNINWLKEFEARALRAKKYNNENLYQLYLNVLNKIRTFENQRYDP
ncbi:MAG TPA: hypothetical protein PLI77_09210 [Bacteroidales bacterium]|nr:hypothetical protein [Bacteroidales bacterium]HRW34688.1 hypothetical protein [Thermotogota bacterium]